MTLKDVVNLQKIGKQTFSASNSAENMKFYLDEGFSIEKMTTELKDKNAAFYFAAIDNDVIGYLKLNFGSAQKELKDQKALEIERIYVLNEYQGKKIGQMLYDKAIKIAKQNKLDFIWLGVWEKNQRAINFYKKNGFIPFDTHIFKLGVYSGQTEPPIPVETEPLCFVI